MNLRYHLYGCCRRPYSAGGGHAGLTCMQGKGAQRFPYRYPQFDDHRLANIFPLKDLAGQRSLNGSLTSAYRTVPVQPPYSHRYTAAKHAPKHITHLNPQLYSMLYQGQVRADQAA